MTTSADVLSQSRQPGRSLVQLREGGDGPPLFFVHGAHGQVFHFLRLVPLLDDTRPCYGFEAPGLWGDEPGMSRYEDLATRYIQEMRAVQPQGPFTVLGFSAGGRIAWEMAQQLRRDGQDVSVGLLDTSGPEAMRLKDGRLASLARPFVRGTFSLRIALGLAPKRRGALLRQNFRYWVLRLSWLLRLPSDNRLTRASLRVGRTPPPGSMDIVPGLYQAYGDYVPASYEGPVALFRAKLQQPGMHVDPQLGWGDLTPGGLEVIDVPGHHGYMFVEPHVYRLAREVRDWAARVQAAWCAAPPAVEPLVASGFDEPATVSDGLLTPEDGARPSGLRGTP